MVKEFSIVVLSICLFACAKEKRKADIAQLVTEWQGKKIVFPENTVFTRYLMDTTDYRVPESDYKVLIYVDSIGCTSCKLQLSKWKELIAYTDSVTQSQNRGNVTFLFFFHPKDRKEINYLLKMDAFDLPVCVDTEDQLNRLNRFPSDITFQTFLLDRENKVVAIGNPIHNLAVKELYLKRISGQSDSGDGQIKTKATVDITDIDMGAFKPSETKQAVFTIRNTGNNPLVIADVVVTCGCTAVKYDKHPASPGESLNVVVDMTPKGSGFFSETITVKTNTKEYVKLNIRGQGS
ncbi:MAG: DUF1573 domain-containing protein [Prevotella sp.]|jgi:hypothetical protein|nr:DUF1573 domain-containing protein [Prevotella sp.]